MIEWDSTTSALNDLLREELTQSWINDAMACYRQHAASAERFAAAGNHEGEMAELREANRYLRQAAYWRGELIMSAAEVGGQSS